MIKNYDPSKLKWMYESINEKLIIAFLFRQPVITHKHFRHCPNTDDEYRFFAIYDNAIVAYAYLGKYTSLGYVVDKDFQGFGIGTQCIERCMKLAYEKNYHEIKSEVDIDNFKSVHMMKKVGFSMTVPIHQTYKDFRMPVLFITYNRLRYSVQALDALMKTKHHIKIFIWDNGSTDGTVEWLRTVEQAPNIDKIKYSKTNVGINVAFNEFIKRYRESDFMCKVDNDTIVEPDWIDMLLDVMLVKEELFACGAFMQRPPGQTFQHWVDTCMKKESFKEDLYLAYNSYTGGTGVMIRTKIFWEHGLLWNGYPCALGDWTSFQRYYFNGKNVAWYSGTVVKLLNIKEDGVSLTDDHLEYDATLKKVRDDGNKWYTKIGGYEGIQKLIKVQGGRAQLK